MSLIKSYRTRRLSPIGVQDNASLSESAPYNRVSPQTYPDPLLSP